LITQQSQIGNSLAFTGRQFDAESGLYHFRNRYYHSQMGLFASRDPVTYVDGLSLYSAYFAPNGVDPLGLDAWTRCMGGVRAFGGGLEALGGYTLGAAGFTAAGATSPTVIGALGFGAAGAFGVIVGAHGVDTFQTGVRQLFSGEEKETLTSTDLQYLTGMSPRNANLTDAGIGLVGSVASGLLTVPVRIATIRATDPLAKGLTNWRLLRRWDTGSRSLITSDFEALGGKLTSPLDKYEYIELGINLAGKPLKTTPLQETLKSLQLLYTGPTPLAAPVSGALGGGFSAVYGGTIWYINTPRKVVNRNGMAQQDYQLRYGSGPVRLKIERVPEY
jgi:RHS repeat-associated protein